MGRLMRAITTSRANYFGSFAADLLCALVMGCAGARGGAGWITGPAAFAAGVFVFTLIEYLTHRWFFHERGKFAASVHRSHHEHPTAPTALPWFSSPTAALLAMWVVPPFFLCGLFSAYFYYSLLHHLQHTVRASTLRLPWLHRRWRIHGAHHARPDTNYGVTTSFWDRVFGTYYLPAGRRSFSRSATTSRVSAASAP